MNKNTVLINELESIVKKERLYLFVTNENEELLLITFDANSSDTASIPKPIITKKSIDSHFVEYDVDFLVPAGEVGSRQYFILHYRQNLLTLLELLNDQNLSSFVKKALSMISPEYLEDAKDVSNNINDA